MKYCDACGENRELQFYRILNKDTGERDSKCNYCIPKICSKCPIDSKTMKDTVKCLQDFKTKGFDKNTKAQLFDSLCCTCFNFRASQKKAGVVLPRTENKTYNGVPMRICQGPRCDGKYIPLINFNIMSSNPNTTRKSSNYQYRCKHCEVEFKADKRKNDEKYKKTELEYNKRYKEDGRKKQKSDERYEKKKDEIIRKCVEYNKKKYENDPHYRIRISLSTRINKVLKEQGMDKNNKTSEALTGCTKLELQQHIEAQFVEGMTWENYGSIWHCDHIIPCCAYDLTIEIEQYKCFNFRNLQPLFSSDNEQKGGSIMSGLRVPMQVVPTPFKNGYAEIDASDINFAYIYPDKK